MAGVGKDRGHNLAQARTCPNPNTQELEARENSRSKPNGVTCRKEDKGRGGEERKKGGREGRSK